MPRRLPERTRRVDRRLRRSKRLKFRSESHPRVAPVREGQEINVIIAKLGSRGDGVAMVEGFPIFVPKARVGEHLKVKIAAVRGKFAIAERIG